jgi:hypothetical protein
MYSPPPQNPQESQPSQQKFCPACHGGNAPMAAVCQWCGNRFYAAPAPAPAPAPPTATVNVTGNDSTWLRALVIVLLIAMCLCIGVPLVLWFTGFFGPV